jgi:hypothetical protein
MSVDRRNVDSPNVDLSLSHLPIKKMSLTAPAVRLANSLSHHQSKKTVLTAPLGESCLATVSPGPTLRGPHTVGVGGAKPEAEHL